MLNIATRLRRLDNLGIRRIFAYLRYSYDGYTIAFNRSKVSQDWLNTWKR